MALTSKLHIETALRNKKTILCRSFCNPPFKIADITEDKTAAALQLMLMSSSPGILDGDAYDTIIEIAEGCRLELFTQSYQRLFWMKKGAVQHISVHLHRESSFTYLPHPVVPHKSSVFTSKNKIHLHNKCSLLWSEIISCGRKLNGEVFSFSSYQGTTEIFQNGKLLVKENLLLKPGEMNLASIGQMEGYSHQATVFYLNDEANVNELAKMLIENLDQEQNISYGISALQINGLIIRMLGYKSEQLFDTVKKVAALCQISKQASHQPSIHVA